MKKRGLSYNPTLSHQVKFKSKFMDHCGNSHVQNSPLPSAQAGHPSPVVNARSLAESLLSRGQMRLLKSDLKQGLEHFESAIKLDPQNPKLYYAQGLSLFEYGNEDGREKALLLASKKFKMATSLDPRYFEAWLAWGSTLSTLGLTYDEHHYFKDAREKLITAVSLSETQGKDSLGELYWELGIVYFRLAEHSGEALDLHDAIECFQKTATFQDELSIDFWRDYGNACSTFAGQINDIRFYIKAISCFRNAVSIDSTSSEAWSKLASAMRQLYLLTQDEDHFSQAHECFGSATHLQPNDAELWLNWAQFLLESTRRIPDPKRLRLCIEKCHRDYAIDDSYPMVQAIWAEALALLGEATERVDLIHDAHNKISEAIEIDSEQPDIWYAYGMCLNACGRYFHDHDYYYQAIEKFQTGLSINRTCHRHWHALGNAYSLLGQIEADPQNFHRAIRFLQKAIDLNASSLYIFDQAVALSKLGDLAHEKKWYDDAVLCFERALNMQRNAVYQHPHWLFQYACTLDALGDFDEEETYYLRAIEIFSHVLMIDPDLHEVHHRLALALTHLGELTFQVDHFFRAIHHYRLSLKHDEENDAIILDWAITLINLAQYSSDSSEADQYYKDAEQKLTNAAKLGNLQAFYHLSCLYSLLDQQEKAMAFLLKADSHNALPPLEEILGDEWLENLRATADFRSFIVQLEHRPNLQEER